MFGRPDGPDQIDLARGYAARVGVLEQFADVQHVVCYARAAGEEDYGSVAAERGGVGAVRAFDEAGCFEG